MLNGGCRPYIRLLGRIVLKVSLRFELKISFETHTLEFLMEYWPAYNIEFLSWKVKSEKFEYKIEIFPDNAWSCWRLNIIIHITLTGCKYWIGEKRRSYYYSHCSVLFQKTLEFLLHLSTSLNPWKSMEAEFDV